LHIISCIIQTRITNTEQHLKLNKYKFYEINDRKGKTKVFRYKTFVWRLKTNVRRPKTSVRRLKTNVFRYKTNVRRPKTNVFRYKTSVRRLKPSVRRPKTSVRRLKVNTFKATGLVLGLEMFWAEGFIKYFCLDFEKNDFICFWLQVQIRI